MLPAKHAFLVQNHRRIERQSRRFGNYIPGMSQTKIESFLCQFQSEDMPVALKLLENLDYYDGERMTNLTRSLGRKIKAVTNNSLDGVLFCPLTADPGTSSHSIQRLLRQTMPLSPPERSSFNQKFINMIDLSDLIDDTENKKIVFIDDFIGSGDTIIESWGRLQSWENENHLYYVGVLVAYETAIAHVEEETHSHLEIIPEIQLGENRRAFNPNNRVFTEEEKEIIKRYCDAISTNDRHRYGHKNGQSLVIFSDRAPNNALPILHRSIRSWEPLFARYS